MNTGPENSPGTLLATGCNSEPGRHIYVGAIPRVNDSCGTAFFDSAESCLRSLAVDAAIQLYEMAEQAGYHPDACAGGRWICKMLLGRFESAWQESDVIAGRGNPDRHRFWDGQPLDGRHVLIRCLHGLGDTIQYIRYAPRIRERARSLTIEGQPALKSLLRQSQLADAVITWGEPEPSWDQQIEIVELPRVFRTTLETIPRNIPYLNARQTPGTAQQNGIKPLKIGVVWASSTYNRARSIPFDQFARLFEVPGASFFSLQAGEERAQLAPWSPTVEDWQTDSACVVATAEKLNVLDLLITVDTMIAHLAGALGRPVWTLLPFQCDWRWMLAREDSPWYPTMRLFRQPSPGDWDRVIAHVIEALHQLTG